MYRIVFTLILLSLFWTVKGQEDSLAKSELDKNKQIIYYDSLTFAQYQNQDFKALIKTAKKAEQSGITFPYLYYRKAIAYYELKNYAKAAKYYEKTLKYMPDDLFLKGSLYLAYLLSGQNIKTELLAKTLPKSSQKLLGYKLPFVNFVHISGGYTFSDNNEKLRNKIANLDTINQYQDMILGGVTVGFNLSSRVKLNVGYNLFTSKFERFAQNNLKQNNFLSQHQFNLGTEIYLNHNFSIGFVGGFYAIEKNHKSTAQTSGNAAVYGKKWRISSSKSTDYNFSALVFLSKRFTYLMPEISFAYSDFAFSNQFHSTIQLTYFPLGNLNFYGSTSATLILDNNKNRPRNAVFSQKIGVRLFGKMWLDGMISVGNHLNYITERSFVVYDTYDPIKFISSLSLSYYFKKITLSATYSWTQREGWALTNYYTELLMYKYNNHLINLGLKWNF
ncbi:MAG TPA: tetratricopeptide repeat protein [Bacteroidales bacterium]|nr:tetratricopeptide repeat protein [Bacteroidales bacterium]HOS57957.1 tetratricopeptide repeat protein [Bacteroidales bacterium]